MPSLDEVLAKLDAMPPDKRAKVVAAAVNANKSLKFIPNPLAQTDCYFSKADLCLFGGQGGGGKSTLIVGLALTQHRRSLIMRRRYTELSALTEEAIKLNGTRNGYNGSSPPTLRTADGRLIEFGAAANLGDEESWQGRPHDFLGVDEAVQFLEAQIRFLMGWVRSTVEGQRTRTVLASNPPINSDGDWIIGMFRPWLDITHHRPAKHGELRWFVTAPDNSDVEVDGPIPVDLDGITLIPQSRTFIPAPLAGNPYLANTDYQARLDALKEPLRSAIRDGNFMAVRKDSDNQVIPTAWVIAAQERWTQRPPEGVAMTAMAIDPGGGGADNVSVAARYGGWYAPLNAVPGEEAPDGMSQMTMVVKIRRDRCPVIVDVGGGYGGPVTERLSDNGVKTVSFNGAGSSMGRERAGTGRQFANKRAEAHWRFREELDPDQEGGSVICLPPDPELRSDLTAARLKPGILKIQIEDKEEIKKRIGRSPGKGDSVIMALSQGDKAALREKRKRLYSGDYDPAEQGYSHGRDDERQSRSNVGYAALKKMR